MPNIYIVFNGIVNKKIFGTLMEKDMVTDMAMAMVWLYTEDKKDGFFKSLFGKFKSRRD
jgi:hypothetical protein